MADRFELLEEVGVGGMGTVWKARDLESGATVALKLLHRQFVADPDYVARFEREVEIAQRVDSPHVVNVLGFGRQAGTPYVAMEYIEGRSLKEAVREGGPLAWDGEGRRIAIDITRGLAAAHAAGVVHRDVKPSNILLDRDGGVHLADFGIARAADFTRLTGNLTVLGTPAYMAPDRTVDERSDLYAVGCVLFEMLTGEPPFVGETQQQVLLQHMRDAPEFSRLPSGARRVVGWLLEKEPARRPGSAAALLAVLQGSTSAPGGLARFSTGRPRRWVAAGLMGVAGIGVVSVAAALMLGGGGSPPDDGDDVAPTRAALESATPEKSATASTSTPAATVPATVVPPETATLPAGTPLPSTTALPPTTPEPPPTAGPTPTAAPIPGTLRFSDPEGAYPAGSDTIDICWDAQPNGSVFIITISKIAPSASLPHTFEFTDTLDGMVNCYFGKPELSDVPFVEFRLEARNAAGVIVASQTNRYTTYVSDFDPEYAPSITFIAGPNEGHAGEPLIFDVSWQDRDGDAVRVSLSVQDAVHVGTEQPYLNEIDVTDVLPDKQKAGTSTRFGLICSTGDPEPRTMTFTITDATGLSNTRTAQLRCLE